MSTFVAVSGFILLLVAFILYVAAMLQIRTERLDKVTTAQCLVVLWLLIVCGDATWSVTHCDSHKPGCVERLR